MGMSGGGGTGTDKPTEKEKEKTYYNFKKIIYHLGLGLGGVFLGAYFLGGVFLGTLNPKQVIKEMKSYHERISIKKEDEKAHLDEVNYEYGRIFENANNSKDSIE
ncbi:MAG: hypothetical protein NTZ83_00765, partial [Candidatus Pacearchaeota archaeon]|nr:hypothetical protein [Candidatus Pacearchaeota archaeon]